MNGNDRATSFVNTVNLLFTGVGTCFFALLFLYVSFQPQHFERAGRDFAISQITKKVEERAASVLQSDAGKASVKAGQFLARKMKLENKLITNALAADVDVLVADILTAGCRIDCAQRKKARAMVRDYFEKSVLLNKIGASRLENMVLGQYDKIMSELRADLRIFFGSNALTLFFAFLLSIFRKPAGKHLLPLSLALVAATLTMSLWYAFGQNWFATVVFNNYFGWSYSVFLGVICLLLTDIAFNRAKFTTGIFNGIGNIFGGAVNLIPC